MDYDFVQNIYENFVCEFLFLGKKIKTYSQDIDNFKLYNLIDYSVERLKICNKSNNTIYIYMSINDFKNDVVLGDVYIDKSKNLEITRDLKYKLEDGSYYFSFNDTPKLIAISFYHSLEPYCYFDENHNIICIPYKGKFISNPIPYKDIPMILYIFIVLIYVILLGYIYYTHKKKEEIINFYKHHKKNSDNILSI